MPTPKQTRYHYKKCYNNFQRLLRSLHDAHRANVIDYETFKHTDGKWQTKHESVCDYVYKAQENFNIATQKQLAQALRDELLK